MRDRLIKFLATGFGAGNFPVTPGTAGSLVGVGYWWLLTRGALWTYWPGDGLPELAPVSGFGAADWQGEVTSSACGQRRPRTPSARSPNSSSRSGSVGHASPS